MLGQKKNAVPGKKIKTRVSKRKVPNRFSSVGKEKSCTVDILTPDCLELISYYLDTKSALSLYQTSKSIHLKLKGCPHFWKHLCKNESFDEYNALKKNNNETENSTPRLSWSGEKFHDVTEDDDSTFWQRQKRKRECVMF